MPRTREKRSFATIRKLPSGRFQVRYTGPDGARHTAPATFGARIDAEAFVVAKRREIDREVWDATAETKREAITFGAYAAAWVEGRQVAGRPIKDRTREHYYAILEDHLIPEFGASPDRRDHRRRTFASGTPSALVDRRRCAPRLRPASDDHDDRGQRRAHRREPLPDPRRRPRQARAQDPAGVPRRTRGHRREMPERYRAMVMLASWCALRFGELTELRRRDIDMRRHMSDSEGASAVRRRTRRAGSRAHRDVSGHHAESPTPDP